MFNTDFSDDLPVEKKEYYSHEVERLSKRSAMADEDSYELLSRQRAMISRNIIGEIEEGDAFALFFYGYHGLSINFSLRLPENIHSKSQVNDLQIAKERVNLIRRKYNLETKESIRELSDTKSNYLKYDILFGDDGSFSKAFRMLIDEIIEKYASRFTRSNYLYRISRVRKTAYLPPSEIQNPKLKKITTGDIIMDRTLWSSAVRAETTIFRYSFKGQSATNRKRRFNSDEEEILFIIKNNEALKAIDISGYKAPKAKEGKSSGELLIKSHTKFKVIGIQKREPRLDRRIVILEPVSDASLKPSEPIKNAYSGDLLDPATLPATTPLASTSATSSTEPELGAVGGAIGGASGSSFPDPFMPDILP
jgi:hypothetical protein